MCDSLRPLTSLKYSGQANVSFSLPLLVALKTFCFLVDFWVDFAVVERFIPTSPNVQRSTLIQVYFSNSEERVSNLSCFGFPLNTWRRVVCHINIVTALELPSFSAPNPRQTSRLVGIFRTWVGLTVCFTRSTLCLLYRASHFEDFSEARKQSSSRTAHKPGGAGIQRASAQDYGSQTERSSWGMAIKFAHRAACYKEGYWTGTGGDASSAQKIIEGTVKRWISMTWLKCTHHCFFSSCLSLWAFSRNHFVSHPIPSHPFAQTTL